MVTEPDNFEQLRKLLALKRHEKPPPGFFYRFTREVMSRVAAHESAAADVLAERTWVARVRQYIELRPWLAGAFGGVVCALLVGWIIYAQQLGWAPQQPAIITRAEPEVAPPIFVESEQPNPAILAASTNPVPPGLFDPFWLNVERVNLPIQKR